MDRFYLTKQFPKRKKRIKGYLDVDSVKKRTIFWGNDESCVAILDKVEIRSASSENILLWGFEPTGFDKMGRTKFKYQEWLLFFVTIESGDSQ